MSYMQDDTEKMYIIGVDEHMQFHTTSGCNERN